MKINVISFQLNSEKLQVIHNRGVFSAGKFKGVSLVTKHASLKLQRSSDCKTMVPQTGEEHLPAYASCLYCFLNTAPLPWQNADVSGAVKKSSLIVGVR